MRDTNVLLSNDGKPWVERLTEDERDWWDWVIQTAIDNQVIPPYKGLTQTYREEFPEGKNMPVESTARRNLRVSIKERGDEGAWLDA